MTTEDCSTTGKLSAKCITLSSDYKKQKTKQDACNDAVKTQEKYIKVLHSNPPLIYIIIGLVVAALCMSSGYCWYRSDKKKKAKAGAESGSTGKVTFTQDDHYSAMIDSEM